MDYFKNYGLHGTNNLAMMTDSNIYGVEINYDLNGNIDSLAREGHNPTILQMDEMKYEYFGGTNQLRLITDHATSSPYGIDYVDSHAGQDYYYDADGNLTKDQEEQIDSIRWTTDGKVRKIVRSSGSTKDELEFKYGPMGNRFIKVVKPRSSGSLSGQTSWKYYYYLRDAQGNTLALYERVFAASDAQYSSYLKRKEVPIYGSSRIGQYTQSKDAETGTFMGEENGSGEIDSLNPHQDPVFNPTWGTTDDNLGYLLPSDSGDYIEIKPRDNGNLILELWALNEFTIMGSDSLAFLDTNSTLDSTVDYTAYSPGGTLIRVGIIGADTNDYIRISGTGILNFMPVDSSDSISVTTDGSLGYIPSGPIWKEDGEFPWRPKDKTYELTNHLGNVMQTIDGQKLGYDNGSDSIADYYTADVLSYTDYYPFGMQMPGRYYSSGYRYGFNGMEKDDEIKGSSSSYDFGARIYDPRVGRWMSRDPLEAKYPNLSPYNFVANSPLRFVDPDGKRIVIHYEVNGNKEKVKLKKMSDISLLKDIDNKFVQDMHKTLVHNQNNDGLKKAIEFKRSVHVREEKKDFRTRFAENSPDENERFTIYYNPTDGLDVQTNEQYISDSKDGTGEIQSPATGFMHETGHFVDRITNGKRKFILMDTQQDELFNNKIEKSAIENYENPTAESHGEPKRTNYGGVPVKTSGPTNTDVKKRAIKKVDLKTL